MPLVRQAPMVRATLTICTVLLFAGPVAATQSRPSPPADPSGRWTASIETQIGVLSYEYEFARDGVKLTGRATLGGEAIEITDGKMQGDVIEFVESRDVGTGAITKIEYSGKLVSPDEVRFTRKVGELATEQFVAKRSKP
jgi:hypothetical protein